MENKKILICDDDAGILYTVEMLLEEEGFTVFTQINSVNVIKHIKETKPDLILLDLWMPLLSGDQVLKLIRNDADIKHIPVVVLSASRDGDKIAFEAGANSFIFKPFDIDHLLKTISDFVKVPIL